jgi:hypothetical protein
MPVQLNHTIVRVRDKRESATFLAEVLGVEPPTPFGPFLVVQVDNDVSLDFADDHGPVHPQHYAFLVGEDEFDQIFGRIRDRGPARSTPTTAAAASTGRTRAATSWRSSPAPTAAAAERRMRPGASSGRSHPGPGVWHRTGRSSDGGRSGAVATRPRFDVQSFIGAWSTLRRRAGPAAVGRRAGRAAAGHGPPAPVVDRWVGGAVGRSGGAPPRRQRRA